MRCAALASVLGLLAGAAAAEPPRRIDNIWNGRDHEPNPAAVHRRERADGLLTPRTARKENRATEKLARQLLRDEAKPRQQRQ